MGSKFAKGMFGSLGSQMEDQRKSDLEEARQMNLLNLKAEIDNKLQDKLIEARKSEGKLDREFQAGEGQLNREAASARDRARMEFDGAMKAYEFAADERRFNAQQATAARHHAETMQRMRDAYELAKTKAAAGGQPDGEKILGRFNDNLTATAKLVEAGVMTVLSLFGGFIPGASDLMKRMEEAARGGVGPGDAGTNGAPATGARASAPPPRAAPKPRPEGGARLSDLQSGPQPESAYGGGMLPQVREAISRSAEGVGNVFGEGRVEYDMLRAKVNRKLPLSAKEKARLEELKAKFGTD